MTKPPTEAAYSFAALAMEAASCCSASRVQTCAISTRAARESAFIEVVRHLQALSCEATIPRSAKFAVTHSNAISRRQSPEIQAAREGVITRWSSERPHFGQVNTLSPYGLPNGGIITVSSISSQQAEQCGLSVWRFGAMANTSATIPKPRLYGTVQRV